MDQNSASLPYMLQERENSAFDAFLYVGETLILKAHKNVLSLAIPFFKRSFESGMREAETGQVKFAENEASSDALCALVCAVYGNSLEINAENVRELHDTANFLEMDDMSQRCVEFMKNNMDADNIFVLWGYAHRNFAGSDKLLSDCAKFIEEHFLELYKNEDFLKQNVDTLCQFLSSKNLSVSSENDVVDALLRWLNHDWENRFRLVNERSLLDLVFWESVNLFVHKLMSVQGIRDRSYTDVVEKDVVLMMIILKLTGLPEIAEVPLSRNKAPLPRRPKPKCPTSEAGFVYLIQNDKRLLIYDPMMYHFHGPEPLKIPEGINNVLGMILHESRPFVVASKDPEYVEGNNVTLLELKNGHVKSAIELKLPDKERINGCGIVLLASPTNSDKFCIGLCAGSTFKMILVYDMSPQYLRKLPNGEGYHPLVPYHCISCIPKTAAVERSDMMMAYTPGKIWVFQTEIISYDLNLKSWSKPLAIDYGLAPFWAMSKVLVAFEYIIIAFHFGQQCQIRMFNYRSVPNGDVIELKCSYNLNTSHNTKYNVLTVSLATMGQQLLVYLHADASSQAFSMKLESDGKPSGELSEDWSMNQFKYEHMLQII